MCTTALIRRLALAALVLATATTFTACQSNECVPQCGDKSCGDNGCGGTCGSCQTGLECWSGQCQCPDGKELCNGACVNVATSELNCGECGHACDVGQSCSRGLCSCPAGEAVCNGRCTSLNTANNCGACGNKCSGNSVCENGECSCPNGWSYCAALEKCVDLKTDTSNCGSCGATCDVPNDGSAAICANGACARRCVNDPPTKYCGANSICCSGNGCTNTLTDANNCGGCGVVCPGDSAAGLVGACDNGTCKFKCTNDPAGKICAKPSSGGGAACDSAGLCLQKCTNPSESVCTNASNASSCVDLSTDEKNCGTCGLQCTASNQSCIEKTCATKVIKCKVTAEPGWVDCKSSVYPTTTSGGSNQTTTVIGTQVIDISDAGTIGEWNSSCLPFEE